MTRKLLGLFAFVPLVFTTCVATPVLADELDGDGVANQVKIEEIPSTPTTQVDDLKDGQEASENYSADEEDLDRFDSKDDSVPQDGDPDSVNQVDVYRIYNPRTGGHLYTDSAIEYSKLVELGWYDEGIAWRSPISSATPVYRLYNPVSGVHTYSTDSYEISAITSQGWQNEGIFCYSDDDASIPVYRLRQSSGNRVFYHLSSSEVEKDALVDAGWMNEGIAFYASSEGEGKAWPAGAPARVTEVRVYRLYNILTGEHLYTQDSREASVLVQKCWVNEGTGWVSPSWSQIPVYRIYNPGSGEHHYTTDAAEVRALTTQHGWRNEGVAWYSSPAKEVPVYRQYNSGSRIGQHHYTSDKREYDTNNAQHGWRGEGIGWYAVAGGQANPSAMVDAQCLISNIHDAGARDMTIRAQNYSSSTNWLILVDNSLARVGIFQRGNGGWVLHHYWAAGPGADRSPTVKGQFTVGDRGYSFGKGYTCYYWVQFYGDYLFHSILYYQGTMTIKDGTLGRRVSHGCVRLAIENAKWIYDNIPRGTKVVSY